MDENCEGCGYVEDECQCDEVVIGCDCPDCGEPPTVEELREGACTSCEWATRNKLRAAQRIEDARVAVVAVQLAPARVVVTAREITRGWVARAAVQLDGEAGVDRFSETGITIESALAKLVEAAGIRVTIRANRGAPLRHDLYSSGVVTPRARETAAQRTAAEVAKWIGPRRPLAGET